jgi:uncharacterized membrane protein
VSAGRLRPVLVAAGIVAYALLQHYANVSHRVAIGAPLAVTLPAVASVLVAGRSRRPVLTIVLITAAAGMLMWQFWSQIAHNYSLLFLLQEAGVYLMLAGAFGGSLRAGHTPLCTQWARMLHGELDPTVTRYTRSVTMAWTAFFVAICLVSCTLFAVAPLRVWSFFSNFMTLPLAVAMFAIEYEMRRRRLPGMRRARFVDMARVYAATMRDGAASRS